MDPYRYFLELDTNFTSQMNTIHVLISYLFMVHFLATFYIYLGPIVTASVVPPSPKKNYSTAPERYSDWNLISTKTIYFKSHHPRALLCRDASDSISKKTWLKSRPRSGVVT